jgi:hypothetical protein
MDGVSSGSGVMSGPKKKRSKKNPRKAPEFSGAGPRNPATHPGAGDSGLAADLLGDDPEPSDARVFDFEPKEPSKS